MLRDEIGNVYEVQKSLPNNHSALLRFRSSVVGDAVGIPFRKVKVLKTVDAWRNPVADALMYSMKCTGKAELRSILSADGKMEDRYIAPEDFIPRLAKQVGDKILYDVAISRQLGFKKIISTIPMPVMMDLLDWKDKPEFAYTGGWTITCDLPDHVNVCATVYLPSPDLSPYRASITDRKLIIEISDRMARLEKEKEFCRLAINGSLKALGLCVMQEHVMEHYAIKRMKYAKIVPIDDAIRKRFIIWASEEWGVYSLGRFATWRPGLLLDDVVNDVRQIQKMAAGEMHAYKSKLKG
jgi:hypothetical protein